jgi:DNA-binding transcriptional LysR family regulator
MKKGIDWESRIGRRLRLRDLHVLFAVSQSGGMAKAAVALGVSQPVVSDAIADLESALGVRLLDRSRRGVSLTLYGQAILSRSQTAFDELRQGVRDIESLADPTKGEVRIGCPESLCAGILPPIIDELSQRLPRVRFQVTQVNTLNPRLEFPELRERKLDVVLARVVEMFGAFDYAEDLEVEKLIDDHLVVVAGSTSPWAARRKISLSELSDVPWILPSKSWNALRIHEAFAAISKEMPAIIIDTFSVALRNQLLATGRFIAAIPASTLTGKGPEAAIKALPVELPDKPWPVAMVTLKNRTLNPAVRHFVECARLSRSKIAKVLERRSGRAIIGNKRVAAAANDHSTSRRWRSIAATPD